MTGGEVRDVAAERFQHHGSMTVYRVSDYRMRSSA
jgi:hypothetical protein